MAGLIDKKIQDALDRIERLYRAIPTTFSTVWATAVHAATHSAGGSDPVTAANLAGIVTSVGTPGTNANVPTEKAVRDAITAGGGGSGITQLTGDVTAGPGSGSQAATLANDAVLDAKLRNSGACSVIGRSANSSGDPADISAASNNTVLKRASNALSFSAVVEADLSISDNTTANVSTSAHGFAPKGDGDTTKFLNASGAYSAPAAAAGGALSLIDTQTPTGSSVTFSSLGSFRHLLVMWSARGDTSATSISMNMTLNGDAGANYDREVISVTGSATPSGSEVLAQNFMALILAAATASAGAAGMGWMTFLDYRGSAFHKGGQADYLWRTSTSTGGLNHRSSSWWWRNTAPITSITYTIATGNFGSGSVLSLYGFN